MNIKQELENAIRILKENYIDEPILKSRVILADILKKQKEYLLVHEMEELEIEDINKYGQAISKLCDGVPLQYITNKQEFMRLEFYVDENVLIPQPDTETLVEETIDICRGRMLCDSCKTIKILDLCTGSGAIGVSIAKNIENSECILLDISTDAINVAKKNCIKNKVENKTKVIQSDLFDNLDENSKFDTIVSNPPYIKSDIIKTLDKEVQKEPILALDGGKDGLDIYRKIINEAYKYLNTKGYLCLEIGYDQKEEVIDLIKKTKMYTEIYSKKDLAGNDRIVICKKIVKKALRKLEEYGIIT